MAISDRLTNALQILETDTLYQKEYMQFVESMSYASENEWITFDEAVQALGRIIDAYNK